MWVDLGLIDLVDAVMNGPQTLYEMPEGSFLSQIRFTDDPDTVVPDIDHGGSFYFGAETVAGWFAVGTVKSFGWSGFAGVGIVNTQGGTQAVPGSYDSSSLAGVFTGGGVGGGYGPFAALDMGQADPNSLVLSAASVGPIQAALLVSGTEEQSGKGVMASPILAWIANNSYDSGVGNFATPGALANCAITANGTIWMNKGASGVSGGTTPDFPGNAGGSVSDGAITWQDTTQAPPTVGAVHVFAEIIMPVVSASPGSIYASVVKKGSVTVAVKNKGNIVANVIQ